MLDAEASSGEFVDIEERYSSTLLRTFAGVRDKFCSEGVHRARVVRSETRRVRILEFDAQELSFQ